MKYSLKINTIYEGDARIRLRGMPPASIDCFVCSPPYWSQRNYKNEPQIWGETTKCIHQFEKGKVVKRAAKRDTSGGYTDKVNTRGTQGAAKAFIEFYTGDTCIKCGAWRGELGLEPNFKMFVSHLLEVFREVKRVMKPTGTLFVNLGDTYGGTGHGNTDLVASQNYSISKNFKLSELNNAKGKLQKTNYNKSLLGIPDRFKLAMIDELGFKCRNEIIWHKPNQTPQSATDRFTNDFEKVFFFTLNNDYNFEQQFEPYTEPSNRWGGNNIEASGYYDEINGNNFNRERSIRPNEKGRNMRTVWSINTVPSGIPHYATYPEELPERCILAGCPPNGIVCDPFSGGGTTLKVAKQLGRKWVGIELNPDFIGLSDTRIDAPCKGLACKAFFEKRRMDKIVK